MAWKDFIAEHSGSMTNLLNKIAEDAARKDFTRLQTFLTFYAESEVRDDVDRRWRDKSNSKKVGQTISGKHEWIPTNMLPYMLSMAAGWGDVRWLIGMEILRTGCYCLIYRGAVRKEARPSALAGKLNYTNAPKVKVGATVSEVIDLQGHVGSLYRHDTVKGKIIACQVGMPAWHGHLREMIRRRLNVAVNDLKGFWFELGHFIGDSIWDGTLDQLGNFKDDRATWLKANAGAVVCDYASDRKGTPWCGAKTLADMSLQQQQSYTNLKAIICNQFVALHTMPAPKGPFRQEVFVNVLEDGNLPSDEDYQEEES